MNQTVTLALDAAGGDHGYDVVIPAALAVVRRHKHAELILVGDQQKIAAALEGKQHPQIKIQHASETVAMDESPSIALRKKKDSSMRVAVDLVKNGVAQACVSAGNTGALIATARYVLKTLPGIDRPALCTVLPGIDGHTHVLDLGANIGCTAEHLYQFAFMGSILSNAVDGIEKPRVGLLNIGEEEMKGNEQVKQAASMLEQSGLNYVGFVEGDGMFKAVADVVVTDGFVGNVALKAAEGLAKMMSHYLRQEFTRNPLTKLAGLIAKPVLKAFQDSVDPRHYNGASVLGLQGIVIKSHGGADATAFANAVDIALIEVRKDVPQRISATLEEQLSLRQPA